MATEIVKYKSLYGPPDKLFDSKEEAEIFDRNYEVRKHLNFIKNLSDFEIYRHKNVQNAVNTYGNIKHTFVLFSGAKYGGYSNGGTSYPIAYVYGTIGEIIAKREKFPQWISQYQDCDGFDIGEIRKIDVIKL